MNILIANRGEIAVRIARTAHALGATTTGVFTDIDEGSLHVDSVDTAYRVASYLDIESILACADRAGATHVHPGYGFLAENAGFAEAVTAAGLIWIGPPPEQIRLLGDKVAAKRAAVEAGVPTTDSVTVDPGDLPDEADLPPFPLLVKAAAGGGGRGMRVVQAPADLADAVASATREAATAFGDGTVFVEPFIERGRHIEVQILGDTHGNVIHLGDRECSIQRRNQKIVEEAPSPGISDDTRAKLHAGAVALAEHVGYVGAGTVEFFVSEPDRGDAQTITFLEVNTRLQVEHPVTEAITGVDLVEMQIGVANGHRLPFTQADVGFDGHAIEVRVVAEDPAAGWLPSTGTIREFTIDDGTVRVDTGFRPGSEVSADYDSMLAKVIAHHADRGVAAAQISRAMRTARIVGITTNIHMLAATMDDRDFRAGHTITAFLDEHPGVLAASGPSGDDLVAHLIALAAAERAANQAANEVTGFAPAGWRNLRTLGQRKSWALGEVCHHVEYQPIGDGLEVRIGEPPVVNDDGSIAADQRSVHRATCSAVGSGWAVEVDGRRCIVSVDLDHHGAVTASSAGTLCWQHIPRFADPDAASAAGAGPVSPLPGTVISVAVEVGDRVEEGDVLMVVEAMKMEHRITAAHPASVVAVAFGAGDRVNAGDLLVELEATTDDH